MTRQELFDRVVTHLLTQNVRASDANGVCKYRMSDGRRCAVGGVLPDKLYRPEMEYHFVRALYRDFPNVASYLGRDNEDLLTELQGVHDGFFENDWSEELRKVANRYGLAFNPPEVAP